MRANLCRENCACVEPYVPRALFNPTRIGALTFVSLCCAAVVRQKPQLQTKLETHRGSLGSIIVDARVRPYN